jgi:hypothetical protein
MNSLPTGKRKSELGLSNNKDVAIQSILGIRIHCFRSLKDQSLILGKNVTVPILASPNEDGTYTVKDGNRRTTALKLLNNPALCPEPDLVPKITKIATAHKNFPSQVDLTVTNNESVMISEVLSRHQGEMAGAGQMGWSAYLRTLYLLNHDHPAEYKRRSGNIRRR